MKSTYNTKALIASLFIIVCLVIASDRASGAIFNVYTVVCAPQWFCTAFDKGDCGSRTCIDVEGCGSNENKPAEYAICEETSGSASKGSRGSSGSGSGTYIPNDKFTISADVLRVTLEQGIVFQKIITVNASSQSDFTMSIGSASSYIAGTQFITTSSNNKTMQNGDFNLIIDSRDILVGTYVIPINISNGKYTKELLLSIDVIPKQNIEMSLDLDANIKTLGTDDKIITFIKAKGLDSENNTITYSIIDPKGNTLNEETLENIDISGYEHVITIPSSIGEGYYTLSVKVLSDGKEYVKSEMFSLLTANKYMPMIESPKHNLTLWIWIIIIIASAITLYNTGLFYKSYTPVRYRSKRNAAWTLNIKDRLTEKMQSISSSIAGIRQKKELSAQDKMEIVKKNYDAGLLSEKEYASIAKRYGYDTGLYDEKTKETDKEAVEAALKRYEQEQKQREEKANAQRIRKEFEEKEKVTVDPGKGAFVAIEKKVQIAEDKPKKEEPIEEKRPLFEKPVETPITQSNIGGAISHIFAQSIVDKKSSYEQAFVLNNHERLFSIRDLMNALVDMPQHFFEHHTQHGRNDFSNWIGDVFQYYDVAEAIRNVKTKQELYDILKKFE